MTRPPAGPVRAVRQVLLEGEATFGFELERLPLSGHYSGVGFHSRASRRASAIWAVTSSTPQAP